MKEPRDLFYLRKRIRKIQGDDSNFRWLYAPRKIEEYKKSCIKELEDIFWKIDKSRIRPIKIYLSIPRELDYNSNLTVWDYNRLNCYIRLDSSTIGNEDTNTTKISIAHECAHAFFMGKRTTYLEEGIANWFGYKNFIEEYEWREYKDDIKYLVAQQLFEKYKDPLIDMLKTLKKRGMTIDKIKYTTLMKAVPSMAYSEAKTLASPFKKKIESVIPIIDIKQGFQDPKIVGNPFLPLSINNSKNLLTFGFSYDIVGEINLERTIL